MDMVKFSSSSNEGYKRTLAFINDIRDTKQQPGAERGMLYTNPYK